MKRFQPLPLKGISLTTAPFTNRSLAWSCDAELAVAADDSVHILIPEYVPAGATDEKPQSRKAEDSVKAGTREDALNPAQVPLQGPIRTQFSSGTHHFPTSYPPLDVRINRHIWDAAGLAFPYGGLEDQAASQGDAGVDAGPTSTTEGSVFRQPSGAGSGNFSSVGSTLNHVVAIEWSPSGVGRNRRPVLAVLTASGTLAVYGEGAAAGTRRGRRRRGQGGGHDASAWEVLWAVGERFLVPPQRQYGEAIVSFAWAGQLGRGRALLAYATDQQECVVISVKTTFRHLARKDQEEEIWEVNEVARFWIKGPHAEPSPTDLDYIPFGTNDGLRFSPWLRDGNSTTAILSYIARGYVGFRQITVQDERESDLKVNVGEKDVQGMCLYLGTNAFLQWEDTLITVNDAQICRGVIATPSYPRPFEVALRGRTTADNIQAHDQETCGTDWPKPEELHNNPIQSLIIHPPPSPAPYLTPIYTAVRLSATATNPDWYSTNDPYSSSSSSSSNDPSRPQWATEIHDKINIALPATFASPPSSRAGSDADASEDAEDDAEYDMIEEKPGLPAGGGDGGDTTDIYLHRFHVWGLVPSPGGGSTAALVTPQSALKPDRGGWYHTRSRVLFGWREDEREAAAPAPASWRAGGLMTTEARMWEWMYGGGPGVPGVPATAAGSAGGGGLLLQGSAELEEAERLRAVVHEFFGGRAALQTCEICAARFKGRKGTQTVCERGHVFDTCSVSGLAIQSPGISRACGVCGLRSLKIEELVKLLPDMAEKIRGHVSGDTCGGCGGKFLD